MSEKDKTIASLRKQLSELQKRCNALEQENALLSYQLDRIDEKELFNIPDYGTDEWADWMIEINKKKE
ncbi:MAG: hypothetical protein LBU37_10600 [Tannerellaceae bacterium]|nr:hypothetical protein [Tannerellaceae bacterium]